MLTAERLEYEDDDTCSENEKTNEHDFIFLLLEQKKSGNFDILIGEQNQKFEIKYASRNRKFLKFKASINKIIEPTQEIFKDTSSKEYKLLGILKTSQAQRIANEFAAYISRIGLNESEYLRRNRKRAS